MTWVCDVVSLDSLRRSWAAGSASVAIRFDIDVSRLTVGRVLSPLCSLACIAVAFSMYVLVCPFDVVSFF
jgi:hypothetical protein